MDRAPEGLPWLLPRSQWLEPVSRLIAPGSPGPPPPVSSANLAVIVASWPTGWVVPFRPTIRVPEAPPPPSPNLAALHAILTVWHTPQLARLSRAIILASGPAPAPPPPFTRSTVEWSVWTNYESWIDFPTITQAIEPPLPPPGSNAALYAILTVWNTPLLARLQRGIILSSGVAPAPSQPPTASTAALNAIVDSWWTVVPAPILPRGPTPPSGPPPPPGASGVYIPVWRPRRRR